jgi:DnaJ-domain-containing protein 1
MKIVLKDDAIVIVLDTVLLRSALVGTFLREHAQSMLVLPESAVLFYNASLEGLREQFLRDMAHLYALRYNFPETFFYKSLAKLHTKTIRLDLHQSFRHQIVDIDIYAHTDRHISLQVSGNNEWIVPYFNAMFSPSPVCENNTVLSIDLEAPYAKSRLQRILKKHLLFDSEMIYTYDESFIHLLYNHITTTETELNNDTVRKLIECYSILECPIGASKEMLRINYKKLVKTYHPDRVFFANDERFERYTRKFQSLQEAYATLKALC